MNSLNATEVFVALLQDCFGLIILFLLFAAAFSWRKTSQNNLFFSLAFTAAIVIGLWKILPIWSIQQNRYAALFISFALFALVIISLLKDFSLSKSKMDVLINGLIHLFFLILSLDCIRHFLFQSHSNAFSYQDYFSEFCIASFLYFSIYKIESWRWFPIRSRMEISKLCLFLAGGFFVIRLIFWSYTAANAFIEDRAGSFRLKGIMFAQRYAQTWQFNNLENLILKTISQQSEKQYALPIDPEQFSLLENGLQEAEALRRRLLSPGKSGITGAKLIAEAIIRFQEAAENKLQNRPGINSFDLLPEEIIEQIEGHDIQHDGTEIFQPFQGKWYGIWDTFQVDHDWGEVIELNTLHKIVSDQSLYLRSFQYAWIGDGFGWNSIASPEHPNYGDVIYGSVYHVNDNNPQDIRIHRPHIGIDAGEGRLIWLTTGEVFLEEIIGADSEEEKYIITGFRHTIHEETLESANEAFQAIYTRDPENRPPFFRFQIDLHIP